MGGYGRLLPKLFMVQFYYINFGEKPPMSSANFSSWKRKLTAPTFFSTFFLLSKRIIVI